MKIETKIILGTAMFFAILLMVGWVVIKEESRMAEFTTQFEGRSLERGATVFESNCSTCHGRQGQGSGRAPALNNPRLSTASGGGDEVGRRPVRLYRERDLGRPPNSARTGRKPCDLGPDLRRPVAPDQIQT
jgi:hypothetical protein